MVNLVSTQPRPLSTISTAAVKNLLGGSSTISRSRKPEIMGDAAYAIRRFYFI